MQTLSTQPIIAPVDLTALLTKVENIIRQKLPAGVTLNLVLGAADCTLNTDGALLMQILLNLLSNSCKFSTKGAISFGYELYDDEISLFVKDSGAGLTSDVKARINDLFEINDTQSPGIGTGLATVNMLARVLNGTMTVESRGAGRGCQFNLYLPYSEGEAAAPAADDFAPAAQNDGFASTGRVRILVAEDNESNFLLVNTVLKKDYDVIRAVDGIEAIEMYKKYHPDLILMDIQMPRMDGYEATSEIRKISPDVPVIGATAYAFVTDRRRLMESGFNGYVSKPINMDRLNREIRNCLGDRTTHVE